MDNVKRVALSFIEAFIIELIGKVRGLLCYRCNIGLGSFKDSTELLSKAIDYLKI